MSMPLEALLRPPVEWYSAIVAFTAAIVMAFVPETLMLLPSVAYAGAAAIGVLGFVRLRQGMRIRRYQKGLLRLPYWAQSPSDIPLSRKSLFLGNGFEWTAQHTQRLYDVQLPANDVYRKQSTLYQRVRRFEQRHETTAMYQGLLRVLQKPSWGPIRNPVAPLPDLGGMPAIHGVGLLEGEAPISQALFERVAHTVVIGTTRVGKTRLCEILVNQDIRRGDCVIVIDPKGDAELLRSMYIASKVAGREKDFMIFHLGFPQQSVRYNPVGDYARITEVATRISRQLPGEGQSATFREFVWGYVNAISRAMDALGRRPDYRSVERFANNHEPLIEEASRKLLAAALKAKTIRLDDDWDKALAAFAVARDDKTGTFLMRVPRTMDARKREVVALYKLVKGELPQFGVKQNLVLDTSFDQLFSLYEFDPGYYSKLTASLLPFLAKLTTGPIADIVAPDYGDADDKRPILEWMSFFRQNGIIYIGLDALSDPDVAAVVGSTMFSDLVSTLGRVYKHGYHEGQPTKDAPITRNIRLHADEFSDLIREDFIPLLNKGGGAGSSDKGGFSATVYTQTLSDIIARLGNAAKAGQTLGNLNTVLMMRVKEIETAEYLTKQLPTVGISSIMLESNTTDTPDATSGTLFRSGANLRTVTKDVPLVHPSTIMSQPKGQAFVIKDGGKLEHIRLPMSASAHVDVPVEIERIAAVMRENYNSEQADTWLRRTPIWERTYADASAEMVIDREGRSAPRVGPGIDADPSVERVIASAVELSPEVSVDELDVYGTQSDRP